MAAASTIDRASGRRTSTTSRTNPPVITARDNKASNPRFRPGAKRSTVEACLSRVSDDSRCSARREAPHHAAIGAKRTACHAWHLDRQAADGSLWSASAGSAIRTATHYGPDVQTRPRPGWYSDPADAEHARWWSGDAWSTHTAKRLDAAELRVLRRILVWMAGLLTAGAVLLSGPQAFGVAMMNFDEHVINTHAVLIGLFGFAIVGVVLLIIAVVGHIGGRTAPTWRWTTRLLVAVVLIQLASMIGVTEHLGLLLFG